MRAAAPGLVGGHGRMHAEYPGLVRGRRDHPALADAADTQRAIDTIKAARIRHGVERVVPVHGLIETLKAVQQVDEIAALPGLSRNTVEMVTRILAGPDQGQ